ncbi:MAG TPA: NAD(+) diphosphatase [Rhizomicrobium sp.]|jgi:NAD+ diphosphatase
MIPFAGNSLDRASHRRTDAAWIESRRADAGSLMHPLWRLQPLLIAGKDGAAEAAWFRPGLCENLMAEHAPWVFLGLDGDCAHFALDISAASDPEHEGPLAGLGRFTEMRAAAMQLPARDVAMLGQAKALIDWHQRHGFCPRCGAPTRFADAGYRRQCDQCGAEHFPRTDPVVIMLALHEDSCLVGRGKQFPPYMFSALAGFIEPGETIEEAVRREIMEEAGVPTGRVTYHTTQPWPFPSSLMIGCYAEALSRDIVLDGNELADACWLTRDMVRALLAGERMEGVFIPPPIAIAHHLLKDWALEVR